MAKPPPFLIIGHPDSLRVRLFVDALNEAGRRADVVSHAQALESPESLLDFDDDERLVRIESAGQSNDFRVALLRRGYERASDADTSTRSPAQLERNTPYPSEVVAPHQEHCGFLAYLASLDEVLGQRPAWRVLSPPGVIAELFDKRATAARWATSNLPICESLPAVSNADELREAMLKRGWAHAYVKFAHGSSASGLALYTAPRHTLRTTLLRRDDRWLNTRAVPRVTDSEDVSAVLNFLLQEGVIVERAVPKAKLAGAYFDLRIIVVSGKAAFRVIRQNNHPITNLHLGGWRGEDADLQQVFSGEEQAQWTDICERAAECYPCLQLGLDVVIGADRAPRLLEGNAFGDLFPRLEKDGQSIYSHEIANADAWI